MIQNSTPTVRWATLVILCIALAVRVGLGASRGFDSLSFGDSQDYLRAAQALCSNSPYPESTELPFFRAPGLPIFLAAFSGCHFESLALLKLAIILLDLTGLIGIMLLTLKLSKSFACALTSGGLYALSPFLIGQTVDLQSEPLFQTLLIWGIFFATLRTFSTTVISGAFWGAAILTRPLALGLIPIALWGLLTLRGKAISPLLTFLLGVVIAIAPWSALTYQRTGEFFLVNDAFGYNFWRGNHPILQKVYDAASAEELAQLSATLEHTLTPQMTAQAQRDELGLKERSTFFYNAGRDYIANNPREFGVLTTTKFFVFLRPWLDPSAWSLTVVIITGIWECVLYIFGLCALIRIWKSSPSVTLLLLAYLTLSLLLNLPFQVVARFRIPLYEWVLIMLTSFELVSRYTRKLK